MCARIYAQVIGAVLLLIGVIGLVLGDQVWLGLLNVDIFEDIVHLVTGGLLVYLGFGRTDPTLTRTVVGVLGNRLQAGAFAKVAQALVIGDEYGRCEAVS